MRIQEIGHYKIDELLGVGGMGEVYRARDTRRDRVVALKLLPEAFSGDAEFLARFRRESFVAARLREPHVIPIHDFGEIDGRLFIDMRLVDGNDLGTILAREGALLPRRAVHVVLQIAEALDAAHADGLVHRDIKPSNVLLTAHDFAYVVDFGVARSLGSTRATALTITGATVGTLDYMAPERFTNAPLDGRADQYSLACVLYEALTGRRPFPGNDLPALMYGHLYLDCPAASTQMPGLPSALDAVIGRGMAKDPRDRYETATAFAQAAAEALEAGAALPADDVQAIPEPRRDEPPASLAPRVTPAPRTVVPPTVPPVPVPVAGPRTDSTVPPEPSVAGDPPVSDDHAGGDPVAGDPPSVGATRAAAPGTAGAPRSTVRRRGLSILAALLAAVAIVWVTTLVHHPHDAMNEGAPSSSAAVTPAGKGPASPSAAASIVPSRPDPVSGADIPANPTPGYLGLFPNGLFGYICNRDQGYLGVFDTRQDKVVSTIPIPQGPPQFVTFSHDGRTAFVSVFTEDGQDNEIVFVDTRSGQPFDEVHVGIKPYVSTVSPDGKTLWVPSHDEPKIYVIDIATAEVVRPIDVKANPHWVAFTPDGKKAYVADHDSNVVTVIDTATYALKELPGGMAPHSIEVSPDGTLAAVVDYDGSTVRVFRTTDDSLAAEIPVGQGPRDVAFAPDGKHFYTTNEDGNSLSVIDTKTLEVTGVIPVDSPSSIAVRPDGREAYVTSLNTGTIRVLDIGQT